MADAETTSADTSKPHLFLHAQFEIPQPAAAAAAASNGAQHAVGGGDEDSNVMDGGTTADLGEKSTQSVIITKQSFDASNCKTAVIGLPDGVEPVKPEPGDYSYSGMHDHGPLPPPKEGGQFAQIISLVSAAKKASDEYLTELIEKEKAMTTSNSTKNEGQSGKQKRKRN